MKQALLCNPEKRACFGWSRPFSVTQMHVSIDRSPNKIHSTSSPISSLYLIIIHIIRCIYACMWNMCGKACGAFSLLSLIKAKCKQEFVYDNKAIQTSLCLGKPIWKLYMPLPYRPQGIIHHKSQGKRTRIHAKTFLHTRAKCGHIASRMSKTQLATLGTTIKKGMLTHASQVFQC